MNCDVDPRESMRKAMDNIRDGATVAIDVDYLDEVVKVHAEKGDTLYTFYCTRADGSTDEVAGIVVRKLLIDHEFHID